MDQTKRQSAETQAESTEELSPRQFTHRYMFQIICILLDQHPNKTGVSERNCVEESLRLAVGICVQDLGERVSYWERVGWVGLNGPPPADPADGGDVWR